MILSANQCTALMQFSNEVKDPRKRSQMKPMLKQLANTSLLMLSMLSLCSCSIQNQLLRQAGNALASETQAQEEDLEFTQHASAYHLKLSESVLEKIPDHLPLAESVTRGFAQYAYAFMLDEADRTQATDSKRANVLRIRAAKMFTRAKDHGLRALEMAVPGFKNALHQNDSMLPPLLNNSLTGITYWTVASWAGAISLSKDQPELVADFPVLLKLADQAWQIQPGYGDGALASLMGTLELSRPGGSSQKALAYFDSAIALSPAMPSAYLAKAENWAVTVGNRDAFVELLKKAIENGRKNTNLTSSIMLRRAEWLLSCVDDFFN